MKQVVITDNLQKNFPCIVNRMVAKLSKGMDKYNYTFVNNTLTVIEE